MALIHTIKINGNMRMGGVVNSTRKSENRRYVACLVTTVTEATVTSAQAQLAADKVELAKQIALREDAMGRLGMTLEQARAEWKRKDNGWEYHSKEPRSVALGNFANADGFASGLECSIPKYEDPTVGEQGVLSWHGTVPNAQKARDAAHWWMERGYKIEIRTDIEVRETVKRVKAV